MKIIYLFVFLSFIANVSFAQFNAYITGPQNICPNTEQTYYLKSNVDPKNVTAWSNSVWEVTDGVIIEGGEHSQDYCKIKWNDVRTGFIEIENMSVTSSVSGSHSKRDMERLVYIRSLNGSEVDELTGENTIDMLSTQPQTYEVSEIKYATDQIASVYSWNIPIHWTHNGVESTGTNTFTTSSTSITVVPDACSEGTIKVWADNRLCDVTLKTSKVKSLEINRPWPDWLIAGPNVICNSETYSIAGLPDGSSIHWTHSSNVQLDSGQGANPATFTKTGQPSTGWIKAEISFNFCSGSHTITKNIWVGQILPLSLRLEDTFMGIPKYEMCYGDPNGATAVHVDGEAYIDEWDWQVTAGTFVIENPYGDKSVATIHPQNYSSFSVKLNAHNTCGWSGWSDAGISVVTCGGYYMLISPNPADTYVNIELIKVESAGMEIATS